MEAPLTKRDYAWLSLGLFAIVTYAYADIFTYTHKKKDCMQVGAKSVFSVEYEKLQEGYQNSVEYQCIKIIGEFER